MPENPPFCETFDVEQFMKGHHFELLQKLLIGAIRMDGGQVQSYTTQCDRRLQSNARSLLPFPRIVL